MQGWRTQLSCREAILPIYRKKISCFTCRSPVCFYIAGVAAPKVSFEDHYVEKSDILDVLMLIYFLTDKMGIDIIRVIWWLTKYLF